MRYILIILPMTIYFFINAIIICLCSYSRHALLFFPLFFHILKLKVVSQITERKYMWKWYIQGVMPHCYNSFFAWKKVEETSAEVIGSRLTFSFQISFYFIHLPHNSYRCGGDGNLMEDTTSLLTSLTKQTKWQIQILEHTTFFLWLDTWYSNKKKEKCSRIIIK